MTINTTQNIVSPYGILIIISIGVSFCVASIILHRKKIASAIIAGAIMINVVLALYFGTTISLFTGLAKGKPQLGLTAMGGAIGVAVGSFILYKISKSIEILKAYSFILPLSYSISKIGCSLAGCCGGIPYEGPGFVRYISRFENVHSFPAFPIQMLESICFLIIFIVMGIMYKKLPPLKHIGINMIICGVVKFGLDFLRYSHIGQIISFNQALCLGAIMLGLGLILIPVPGKNGEKPMTE